MLESRLAPKTRRLFLLVSMIATVVVFLAPAAEAAPTVITVTKTAAPAEGGSVAPGSTITYNILIANGAGDIATGVSLTDATPANTTYVAGSASINGGPPIAGATNPFADGEAIPNIPASGSATATFQVTVNSPLANGTALSNTATVTAANADVGSDLDDVANHTVASAPVLAVNKSSADLDGAPLEPGDTITYTVVVENIGTDTATGVELDDPLPSDTTYVSNSAELDGVNLGAMLYPFQSDFPLGNIAGSPIGGPAPSRTIAFDVVVDSPLTNGTVITNTATASATNAADAQGTTNDPVTSMPGLTVDKTASPAEGGPITPGDTITYTIVVANDPLATETATGLSLTDATPTDTTYVADSATVDTVPETGATNPFESGFALPDLDPGDSLTLTFQALVDTPLDNGTEITNTATVTSDQGPDATDEAIHTVQSAPELTLEKTSAPAEGGKVTPGTTITYSITVSNSAEATEEMHNAQLIDPTPANTSYVAGSAKLNGAVLTGSQNPFGGEGLALPDLAPDESHTVTFDVKVVSPLAKGTVISNLAELTAADHPDLQDDATHTVDSAAVPKLAASATPKPGSKLDGGDTITYTVDASNDPAATDSLAAVTLSAPTPEGTTFVEGSARLDGATVSRSSLLAAPSGPNPLSSGYALGNMAPGVSHSLSYKVKVKPSAGTITNTITLAATNAPPATVTITHRGPNTGSGGGGDGSGSDGAGSGSTSGDTLGSTSAGGGLAFTGLDLMKLLLLALTLLLAGWTLLAGGHVMQRRAVGRHRDGSATGSPAWDRWAGAWFYPQRRK